MRLSRRRFIGAAATATAAWPLLAAAQATGGAADRLFVHGVASGDPLADRVILWTRVTVPDTRSATGPVEVRWQIASDERLTQIVARGTGAAAPERDFTVKVDAEGLQPGRTYYYAFDAGGERSPVGRTRTLPAGGVERVRIAAVSCSNYPAGYFNVYRCLANRDDLDAVVHLGDYIYEFADGVYGDGKEIGRQPLPGGEAITLADYRLRYAVYRSDIDLQQAHARHPFIAVWDDHEIANDAWSGGAGNHDASEGEWPVRRAAAYQAYMEWMPVRGTGIGDVRLYRELRFGDLADLLMLDTRGLRDRQLPGASLAALAEPSRSLLGAAQEQWFFDGLRRSQRGGTRWRLVGQQVLFAPITPPAIAVQIPDVWDGYPAARARVFDVLAGEKITNVAILTGDAHSSWALDVPRSPWRGYNGRTGSGSLAVELVTPAISSPPRFADETLRQQASLLRLVAPHLKYLEGDSRGYILIDVTRSRLQADFYFVPTVATRSAAESKAMSFVCEHGSSRLVQG
jgi:alkaline phosphatase D